MVWQLDIESRRLTPWVDMFMSICLTFKTSIMIGSWLSSTSCIFLSNLGSSQGLLRYFVTSSPHLSYTSLVNFLSAVCTSVFSTAPFCLYVRMFYVSSSTLYSLLQSSVLGTMKPTYACCLSHMLPVQWWLRPPALLPVVCQVRPLCVFPRIVLLGYPWGIALRTPNE
jgi:hypothetical protein